MTPDTQTSTSQYVSVIADHLSLRCEVKTAHDTGYTDLNQHIGREQVPNSQLLVLHICICKYDYTPAFGNWQARKVK